MFARKMEDEQLDGAKGDEHQAEYRKGGNKGNLKDTRSQITINRQDSAFVVFMHTGVPNSLAESTCKVAQSWHEMKSKTAPERLTSSEMELGLLTHNEDRRGLGPMQL
ncbi:hypothetical protein AK812_SmicGene22778 [Symbiodinium microadriaticum]|uniref:Uncharacterized protein n=1 Tax=Symbiodinium microadriaticum TaxID=2951 RepID=A0A1Q9DIX5_SYMMI|nr:hypothetical protein AK812_SmicGene22778 [Symbiodinium microadriaticum]